MGSTRLILAQIQAFNSREETPKLPHTEEQTLVRFPQNGGQLPDNWGRAGFWQGVHSQGAKKRRSCAALRQEPVGWRGDQQSLSRGIWSGPVQFPRGGRLKQG